MAGGGFISAELGEGRVLVVGELQTEIRRGGADQDRNRPLAPLTILGLRRHGDDAAIDHRPGIEGAGSCDDQGHHVQVAIDPFRRKVAQGCDRLGARGRDAEPLCKGCAQAVSGRRALQVFGQAAFAPQEIMPARRRTG